MWFFEEIPKELLETPDPSRPEYLDFFVFLDHVIPVQQLLLLVVALDAAAFEIKLVDSPVFQIL